MCQQRAIFPVRLQTSIFATAELNFRVRNGNGWTLCVKVTDFNELNVHWKPNKGMLSRAKLKKLDEPGYLCRGIKKFKPSVY